MIYNDIDIDPGHIKEVVPWHNRVLLSPLKIYASLASNLKSSSIKFFICIDNIDEMSMTKFKYEHIKHIKTLPDPDDRVAHFEIVNEYGFPDFEKERKLIEGRKTRQEKQKEIKETMSMIAEFEKAGLDCDFLKDDLKTKLQGGY